MEPHSGLTGPRPTTQEIGPAGMSPLKNFIQTQRLSGGVWGGLCHCGYLQVQCHLKQFKTADSYPIRGSSACGRE